MKVLYKIYLFIVTNPFVLPDKNTESCPDSKRFSVCFEVGIDSVGRPIQPAGCND